MKTPERIHHFCDAIWDWYAVHKRTLPWRDLKIKNDTQRAYMILVSEVMLQQTQVERVKIVFRNFLELFATIFDLAEATNADVILAWRGMGYNSRALRLRDAAKIVVETYKGKFPKEMDELLSIKGIGAYTAAAIRNFAFDLPTPCIDTNIRRILHRTFYGPENPDGTWKKDDATLLELAHDILEVAIDGKKNHTAREWHAALMDFGSMVQTKRSPKWDICPLTAKKIMVTTPKMFEDVAKKFDQKKYSSKQEPGRLVAGKHIPNRIFRGRIVEALRDHPDGLTLEKIGAHITVDWDLKEHRAWLEMILEKLEQDQLIARRNAVIVLQ